MEGYDENFKTFFYCLLGLMFASVFWSGFKSDIVARNGGEEKTAKTVQQKEVKIQPQRQNTYNPNYYGGYYRQEMGLSSVYYSGQ